MSEGIICDGCGEPIDTDREQWIEIKISREKSGLIGKNDDSFPVEDKKLHFHGKESDSESLRKNCIENKISKKNIGRKILE